MTMGIGSFFRRVETQILVGVVLMISLTLGKPDVVYAQGGTIRVGALEFRCDGCVDAGDGLCRVMLLETTPGGSTGSSTGKSTGRLKGKLGLDDQTFVVCSELLDEVLTLKVSDLKRQIVEGGSHGEIHLANAESDIRPAHYKVGNFNLLPSSALRYIGSAVKDSSAKVDSSTGQDSGSLGDAGVRDTGLNDGRLKVRLFEYLLLSNANDASLAGHLSSLSEHELGNIMTLLEKDSKVRLPEEAIAKLWKGLLLQRNKKLVPFLAYCLHLMPNMSIGQVLVDSSSLFVQSQSDQRYRYALSGWLSSLGEALLEIERVKGADALSFMQSQDSVQDPVQNKVPYSIQDQVQDPSKLSSQLLTLASFLRECSLETSIELRAKSCQLAPEMLRDASVARLAHLAIAEATLSTESSADTLSSERDKAKIIITQSLLGLLICLYLFRIYGRFRQNDDKLSGYDVADKISIAETERLRALLRKFDLPVKTSERILSEAFRNCAKLSHPDLHPDKQEDFRELNEAYEEAKLLLRKFNNTVKKT